MVGQHHFAARKTLSDLHETDPHQIELVARVTLPVDDLSGLIAQQLGTMTKLLDDGIVEPNQERHAAEMRIDGFLLVAGVYLGREGLRAMEQLQNWVQHLDHHRWLHREN